MRPSGLVVISGMTAVSKICDVTVTCVNMLFLYFEALTEIILKTILPQIALRRDCNGKCIE